MFKHLHIQLFQSHEDTLLYFDNGVNVIFGLSQAGKTAIARAMRLLIDNRPLGGRFFSDFAGDQGETKITLGLDESKDISIEKSIRINKDGDKQVTKTSYKIGDIEFSSPRDQVPDQVVSALNISELNIQRQFDPPFLVSASGGEIAKTINRITRLEEVDEWVAELTSEINAGNRDAVRMEGEAKDLIKELEQYGDLYETEKIVADLKSTDGDINSLFIKERDLDRLLLQIFETSNAKEKLEEFLPVERYILKIEKLQFDIDLFDELEESLVRIEKLKDIIDSNEIQLRQLTAVSGDLDASVFDDTAYNTLKRLLRSYEQSFDDLGQKKDWLINRKNEYLAALEEIKKCPICLADIDSKHIKQIAKEL